MTIMTSADLCHRGLTLADTLVRVARGAASFFISPDGTAYAAIEVAGHHDVWPLRTSPDYAPWR